MAGRSFGGESSKLPNGYDWKTSEIKGLFRLVGPSGRFWNFFFCWENAQVCRRLRKLLCCNCLKICPNLFVRGCYRLRYVVKVECIGLLALQNRADDLISIRAEAAAIRCKKRDFPSEVNFTVLAYFDRI